MFKLMFKGVMGLAAAYVLLVVGGVLVLALLSVMLR